MDDFDRIIAAEKHRHYHVHDQDQFVFDTLASIQASKTRQLTRLLILLTVVLVSVAVAIQFTFLQAASFSELASSIQQLLAQKPYHLALLNLALIGVVLFIKRVNPFR